MGNLNKIVKIDFSGDQYYKTIYDKSQIVLHHTVSGGSAKAVANYWESTPSRVATAIIIDKKGIIHQLFGSQFYAGHIGDVSDEFTKFKLPYRNCSKASIGVELVAWGGLKPRSGKLYNTYGDKFEGDSTFYEKAYRGFKYFDTYTQAQIDSLKELLRYWADRYNIPTSYTEDIWQLSKPALKGTPGIYTHTSFRNDKSDLHPQENLIEMLKTL